MGQNGKTTAKRRTKSNAPEKSKKDQILAQLRRKTTRAFRIWRRYLGGKIILSRIFLRDRKEETRYSLMTEKPNKGAQRYYIRDAQ